MSKSDELLDEILNMEMQTLYSQAHKTGVRVQLTEQSKEKARKLLEQLLQSQTLEVEQQAWNKVWAEWMKGDDDEFDTFMREYNAELWSDNQKKGEGPNE